MKIKLIVSTLVGTALIGVKVYAQAITVACDNTRDWQPEIQAAINTAEQNCGTPVELIARGKCKINEGLTATTCAGWIGNGVTLNASGMPQDPTMAAMTVKSATPGSNYNGNIAPWTGLNIIGNGITSSAANGLVIAASNWSIRDLNIQNTNNAVVIGNYGYSDDIYDAKLIGNNTALWCKAGTVDAGERLNFVGGVIANGAVGINNTHCEFNLGGMSIDALSQPIKNYAGVIHLTNDHVEKFNNAPILNGVQQSNAYTHITVASCDFYTDNTNASFPLVVNAGNAYVQAMHIFLSGWASHSGFIEGQGSLCGATSGAGGGSLDNVANEGPCP